MRIACPEEGAFQTDVRPAGRAGHVPAGRAGHVPAGRAGHVDADTLFWFTDMGWIMGPWEVTAALANGATLALYEGAPDWPEPDRLWAFLERHRVSIVGIILMNPKLHGMSQPHPIYFLQMVVQGSIIRAFRGVPRWELEEVIAQIRDWRTKCAV